MIAAEEPTVDLGDPGQLTQTEADLPLLGEHDMDDICLPRPDQRQHRRPATRSGSPTATSSGARSARPSTSASTRPTAGSAACRSATSPGSGS